MRGIAAADLFPTDRPIKPDEMVGRNEDVRDIADQLGNGVNVVLAGPRRTGKTSVCDAALAALRARGFYVVSEDLFARRDAADLAEGLVVATVANRRPAARLLARVRELAHSARDAATLTATARLKAELGEDIEIALSPGSGTRDAQRALRYALELPQRIALADDKRAVVFLDEFQEVAATGQPFGDTDRVTKEMRAIFQRSDRVSYLFAGSIEHLMLDLFAPSDRALSQFGSFRHLTPISPDDWQHGLGERFQRADCRISTATLTRLVELGAGHPRSTMLIARETLRAARLQEIAVADAIELEAGFQAALAHDRLRHEQVLERIRMTKHAQAIAMRIARSQRPYPGTNSSQTQRALRALELTGIAQRSGRGDWQITDPLLARYLADLPGA
jgi:uncharacterized protein